LPISLHSMGLAFDPFQTSAGERLPRSDEQAERHGTDSVSSH